MTSPRTAPRTRQLLVPLSEARLVDAETLLRAYASTFPGAGALKHVPDESDADTLSLRTATITFKIGLLPSPIPAAQLDAAVEAAWYWPEAARALSRSRACAVISAQTEHADAIDSMFAITRVAAAFASVSSALGVLVPGAGLVHRVDDFVSEAATASREQLPLYLWVRFQLAEQADGTISLYTTGLAQFGLMELEFPHSPLEPQDMMDRAFNVAHYVLERGPVLSHGHTMGTSANEMFHVTHGASERDGHPAVVRLALGRARSEPPELLN